MRRFTPAFPFIRAALALAALLSACGPDRVAGGYDDVENPALTLSLQDPQGGAFGSGEVRVYARFHNPTQDTLPLLTRTASTNGVVTLDDSVLVAAMRQAHDRGIPWPSADSVEFNVVSTAGASDSSRPTAEAYAGNFLLLRMKGNVYSFRQRVGVAVHYPDPKGVLPVSLPMRPPVVGLHGSVGAIGLEVALKSVFVPGSPYWSRVAPDGSFTLAHVASGRFELKGMSEDGKVYSAENSLDTDAPDSSFEASNWSEADIIWIEK